MDEPGIEIDLRPLNLSQLALSGSDVVCADEWRPEVLRQLHQNFLALLRLKESLADVVFLQLRDIRHPVHEGRFALHRQREARGG